MPAEIEAVKAESGGDMAAGGADLAAEFMRHELVDEVCLYVHRVILGEGKPLFPPSERATTLRSIETRFGSGVLLLRYEIPKKTEGSQV